MALLNIHEFVDEEVITADNLNSIGEAVSAEVGGGNIPSSSLVWPFIAQGDIDMNGYSITGIASFFGEYHVNSSQTLHEAIASVNGAGGGTIIVDDNSSASALDQVISASNVSIIGTSGKSLISVSSGSTLHGIKVTGNNFRMEGCQITGGAAGIPAVLVENASNAALINNTFSAYAGSGFVFSGSGSDNARVSDNVFAYIDEVGIDASALYASSISSNTFDNVDVTCILLGDGTGTQCSDLAITGNTAYNCAGNGIDGSKSTGTSSNFGQLSITGNAINVSGESLILGTYINSAISGNSFQDPCSLSCTNCTITGNTFNSTCALDTTTCIIDSNRFQGEMSNTSGAANSFTNNQCDGASAFDNTWARSVVSNIFEVAPTVASEPDVVGLNWGY